SHILHVFLALYELALFSACVLFYLWGRNNRLSSFERDDLFCLDHLALVSMAFLVPIPLFGIMLPYLASEYLAGKGYPQNDDEYFKSISFPAGVAETHYKHVLKTRCESYRVSCG